MQNIILLLLPSVVGERVSWPEMVKEMPPEINPQEIFAELEEMQYDGEVSICTEIRKIEGQAEHVKTYLVCRMKEPEEIARPPPPTLDRNNKETPLCQNLSPLKSTPKL
jgi:hypothetical protein